MKFQKLRRIFSAVLSAAIVLTPNCCHATLYCYQVNRKVSNSVHGLGGTEYFYTTNADDFHIDKLLTKRFIETLPKSSKKSFCSSSFYAIAYYTPVKVWIFDYEKFGNGQRPAEWNLISVLCSPSCADDLMCVPTPQYFKDKPDLLERFRTVLLGRNPHAMAKQLDGDLPRTLTDVFIPKERDANGEPNPQYFDRVYDFAAPESFHAYFDRYHFGPDEDWYEDSDIDPELWDDSLESCICTIYNLHCYLRACRITQAKLARALETAARHSAEERRCREAAEKAREEKERKAAEEKAKDNAATSAPRSNCTATPSSQTTAPGLYYNRPPLASQPASIANPQSSYFLPVQTTFGYTNAPLPFYGQTPPPQYNPAPMATMQQVTSPYVPATIPLASYSQTSPQNIGYTNAPMPFYGQQPPQQYYPTPTASMRLVTFPPMPATTPLASYSQTSPQNIGYTNAPMPSYGQQPPPYYK